MILNQPHLIMQGGLFRLKMPKGPGKREGGGTRKAITVFSNRSRRNLMEKFATTDWRTLVQSGTPVLFCTLTLTPEYWDQLKVCKRGLARLQRWLLTLPGFQGGMVRKEYGAKRGALHYHLILLGLSKLDLDQLRQRWSDAMRYQPAEGAPRYLRVDVQKAESSERVCKYLCKYVAKAAWEGAAAREGSPVRGEGPARGGALRTLESAVTLSKAQIATRGEETTANIEHSSDADTHTGTRYWSFFGDWPFSESEVIPLEASTVEPPDILARKLAARVRRLFRKWRAAVEYTSTFSSLAHNCSLGGGDRRPLSEIPEPYRAEFHRSIVAEAQKTKATFRRKKLRWCRTAGGFALFLSPTMIESCLYSAFSCDVRLDTPKGKVASWI